MIRDISLAIENVSFARADAAKKRGGNEQKAALDFLYERLEREKNDRVRAAIKGMIQGWESEI